MPTTVKKYKQLNVDVVTLETETELYLEKGHKGNIDT